MRGTPVSTDEQAAWWKSLTQSERAQALKAAGWTVDGSDPPSVADAWTVYKLRTNTVGRKPLRYVVLLGRYKQQPHVFDTLTRTRLQSYPTAGEAERQAMFLNHER